MVSNINRTDGISFLWAKLKELGNNFGLTDDELNRGLAAMLNGAVELMYHFDLSPEQVMDLIPVYPLKEKELKIKGCFDNLLKVLHQKLTGGAK